MTFSQKYWLSASAVFLLVAINIWLLGKVIRWGMRRDISMETFILITVCISLLVIALPMCFIGQWIYGF